MRVALLFPGQGAQAPGMCDDLLGTVYAASLDAAAREVLGYSLVARIREATEEELKETTLAQPALYFVGYLTYVLLTEKYDTVVVGAAGHSLGEITALAAARVFTFEDGLRLVAERAKAMEKACRERLGGMVAVIGDGAHAATGLAAKYGVYAANFNAENQIVFAGELKRLDEFRQALAGAGFRAVLLKVSGPFHSPYMEGASRELGGFVGRMRLARPAFPVMSNVTGEPYDPRRTADLIVRQVSSPVRWTNCVQALATRKPEVWVEACPGRTLTRLLPAGLEGERVAIDGSRGFEAFASVVRRLQGGGDGRGGE